MSAYREINRIVTVKIYRNGELMRNFQMAYTDAVIFRMLWEKAHADDDATVVFQHSGDQNV